MENMNNWDKVENALIKLEQLNQLAIIYAEKYLDIPKGTFIEQATSSYDGMVVLDSLKNDLFTSAKNLLNEATEDFYRTQLTKMEGKAVSA